eukprot:COSAG01_NODE_746_length_13865_cov_11.259625_8_plen_82_part_00
MCTKTLEMCTLARPPTLPPLNQLAHTYWVFSRPGASRTVGGAQGGVYPERVTPGPISAPPQTKILEIDSLTKIAGVALLTR